MPELQLFTSEVISQGIAPHAACFPAHAIILIPALGENQLPITHAIILEKCFMDTEITFSVF